MHIGRTVIIAENSATPQLSSNMYECVVEFLKIESLRQVIRCRFPYSLAAEGSCRSRFSRQTIQIELRMGRIAISETSVE